MMDPGSEGLYLILRHQDGTRSEQNNFLYCDYYKDPQ